MRSPGHLVWWPRPLSLLVVLPWSALRDFSQVVIADRRLDDVVPVFVILVYRLTSFCWPTHEVGRPVGARRNSRAAVVRCRQFLVAAAAGNYR